MKLSVWCPVRADNTDNRLIPVPDRLISVSLEVNVLEAGHTCKDLNDRGKDGWMAGSEHFQNSKSYGVILVCSG